jgi:hypothetical protein
VRVRPPAYDPAVDTDRPQSPTRRWPWILLCWLVSFLAFTGLALGFDANGSGYHALSRAFAILSFATIPAAIVALVFRPQLTRVRATIAVAGLAIASVALGVALARHGGSTLAWVAFAGLLGSTVALVVPARAA